jgi:hypothetical protein
MIEHGSEVDRGRVTANADGVDGACRLSGGKNHEAQREGRKAPDQTQCQFSAVDERSGVACREANRSRCAINDMNVREIKGFPPMLGL